MTDEPLRRTVLPWPVESSLCLRRTALCLQPCGPEGPFPNSPGSLVLEPRSNLDEKEPGAKLPVAGIYECRCFLKNSTGWSLLPPFCQEQSKDRPRVPMGWGWGEGGEGVGGGARVLDRHPAGSACLTRPLSPSSTLPLEQTGGGQFWCQPPALA